MNPTRTQILDGAQIERKIQRIARQIMELHHSENELTLIGIAGQGAVMCERLVDVLHGITSIELHHETLRMHKDAPLDHPIKYSGEIEGLRGKHVVLVDDVLNSGRTLIYAVKYLLDHAPRTLHTAVLVDRFHRSFPVRADFCGLTLSTTVKEHIEVEFRSDGKSAAYIEAKANSTARS